MIKFKIEKRELLYALLGVIFLIAWFLYVRPLITPFLDTLFPFISMLLYNIGTIFGLYLISFILSSRKIRLKASFITWIFFIGEDIIQAPYVVAMNGVINKGVELWSVSTDAGFASLYQLFLPLNFVWFFTYIITPALLLLIIPIIIASPKTIKKMFM